MSASALLLTGAALVLWPVHAAPLARVAGPARTPLRLPAATLAPLATGAAVVLGLLLGSVPVGVLAGAAAAGGLRAWRHRRSLAREESRLAALADGLGALAAELRGGRSLEDAIAAAAAACGNADSGRALARAVRAPTATVAQAAGDPGEAGRVLGRVAAAVRLSTRSGCSLAGVLGAVEDDLRARRRHRLDLASAAAGPRASAVVLAALPLLALAMGGGVGADPWRVLTTTATGSVLLVVGAALEWAGLAWSARLVRRALR